MQKIMMEILPDGSIGARYSFNTETIPAQPLRPGATLLEVEIPKGKIPENVKRFMEAKVKPHEYIVIAGKLRPKLGNGGQLEKGGKRV